MMLSAPTRTREYAKNPSKLTSENDLFKERQREEKLRMMNSEVADIERTDGRLKFERQFELEKRKYQIRDKVKQMKKLDGIAVDVRRDKLRDMLGQEEQHYYQELDSMAETTLERQARLREQARVLRETRERELKEMADEKREQQFRNTCTELRAQMSQRMHDQTKIENLRQAQEKQDLKDAYLEEQKIYDDLLKRDYFAKMEREEADAKVRFQESLKCIETLHKQMAALDAKKQQEEDLKREEAILMDEQNKLRALEKNQALEEKRRKQKQMSNDLTRAIRQKARLQGREVQEQLAYDMKMMEELMAAAAAEVRGASEKKARLNHEALMYRKYLQEQLEQERLREKELDNLIDAEVEKNWQKRVKQWRMEREAREALLRSVLDERRKQIEDRLHENERHQAEAVKEREEILRKIEENKRLEAEAKEKVLRKNLQYQQDLQCQLDYEQRQAEQRRAEQQRETDAGFRAESAYQEKLTKVLSEAEFPRVHPLRRHAQSAGTVPQYASPPFPW